MRFFIKIFVIGVLFLFAFVNKSFSETVNKVKIVGNDRITLESILVFGDIEIGSNYESSDINLLIKKLYETNFFLDISVELKNNLLIINVRENPIINSIVFKGEKAEKYIEALTSLLTLREKTSYVKNYVKSDINIVKEFYRQLGFYFVKIDLDIEKLDSNRINLIYKLDKGEKAKISKIYFLGDKKIKEKRLRSIVTSEESRFWKFLTKNVYVNKGRIELDKRLLKNYYKNIGYYEVDITSSNVEYSEGEGFALSYTINAGKRYKFSKIFLDVDPALDKSVFLVLEDDFNKIIGNYYSRNRLTKILEKVDELSDLKELQFINHGITEVLEGDGVEVAIRIFEGKKFTIERINIIGNNITNDAVIRSEMIVDEGDPYSAVLINKSLNKLKARNIFSNVGHKITEGSTPDLKILEVTVEEKPTGEISAGAGVGSDGTSFMFSVKENNWLGKGIKLQSVLNLSTDSVSGKLFLANPNYKFSGNKAFASLDVSSSDFGDTSGYESKRNGASIGTEFEHSKDVYISPQLAATYEDIEVKGSASSAIKKMEGTYSNIDLIYGITIDKRNQTFQTTSGYWTKFLQSVPLVMDSSSFMNGFDFSTYHPLTDDVVGKVKFYSRSIHGMSDEDVRLTSRLHIPQNRLRGFQKRRIGPKDGSDFIGGNYAMAIGFESEFPNLLPDATKTDISLFLDAANLWHIDYSDTLDDSNKIRSSIGIAANMWTVIGPLSLTMAQDITKADTDKTEGFNFRLGTSF